MNNSWRGCSTRVHLATWNPIEILQAPSGTFVAILSHRFRPAMTFFDIDNRRVRSHHIERSLPFCLSVRISSAV